MNRLAAGIDLKKNVLVDTVLNQRHYLSDEGSFIVNQWLKQRNSRQIAETYAQAFGVSKTQAREIILDLLLDLSRHYILEIGRWPRRFVVIRLRQLSWVAVLILMSQLPMLLLVGFTFAMIGLGLGYPIIVTVPCTMGGLWAMLLLHEFGHAAPLIFKGHKVVMIRERVRIRLLYSHSAHSSLVVVASGLGPVLAAVVGICCAVIASSQTNITLVWVLFIISILGVWQLFSLLPVFEDGKTIRQARSNA